MKKNVSQQDAILTFYFLVRFSSRLQLIYFHEKQEIFDKYTMIIFHFDQEENSQCRKSFLMIRADVLNNGTI